MLNIATYGRSSDHRLNRLIMYCFLFTLIAVCISGCAMKQPMTNINGIEQPIAPDTIINCNDGVLISFGQMIESLDKVRVIYVGEQHNDPLHHEIQLKIIKGLKDRGSDVSVGMEMFDYTYQNTLNQWSEGKMVWSDFLKQAHWYANWKFDDSLYEDILLYVKTERLRLIGLNIPFHLPAKISIGGLDSLSSAERAMLPERIDTSNSDHRAYIENVYKAHSVKGRDEFESFYEAQCVWEDSMASKISDGLGKSQMVVLVGKGHIVRKFGIPDRVYKINQFPFKTIYLTRPGEDVNCEYADIIWVTGQE